MSYQRSQTPTTAPLQAPAAPQTAPAFSPFLTLQGLIGNAGVLDMLRPQMPAGQRDRQPSPPTGAAQTVLRGEAATPTPPPGGTEIPSSAVATTLADQGQTAAITRATSSPAQTAAHQVSALDETQAGVEGAILDSPTLATAIAAELGTTPSENQAHVSDHDESSWWDDAVDWTVGGVGSLLETGVDALSDVPLLGTAAATMAPVTKFAWETLGGIAKGAGDMVGGLANIVAHPLDFLEGMGTMLEHIPGSPIKLIHKLYDVAAGNKTLYETFLRNPINVFTEDLGGDYDFWAKVVGAILEPFEKSVEQGKYGEAIGRGVFDVGSLFVGAGELKALGKGAKTVSVLNKVDDSVKVASKVNELGTVTDDIARAGGKGDDLTKATTHVEEAADLNKVEDSLVAKTDQTTIQSEASAPQTAVDEVSDLAFQLDPKKHDYFFGRVERPPEALKATDPKQYEKLMHNYHRSQQLKGVFEDMGIADTAEGRKTLDGLFQEGTSAPTIAEHKGAYGTTVTRAVERDGVILEIKYFYKGGDMASKPKVVTVIPKVIK